MDDVWGPRQRAETGADPFEHADRPESDPAASAAGDGRRAADALPEVRRRLADKREESDRVRRARGDVKARHQ